MSYLVTGGAGFIGNNLVETLLSEGREVVCLDKNAHGTWHSGAKNYVGSINNVALLTELIDRYDVETIFHMAAEASIQVSIDDPVHTMKTNVLGTSKVLETAKKCGVKKLVFSSTCAVYDGNETYDQDEHTWIDCKNPYALSKYIGEQLCESYSNDISITVLRYFNVYGKGHRIDGAYPPVIAIFMDRYKNNLPLEIVGSGTQRRDFVNVVDVVRANIMVSDSNDNYGVYNVGSGTNYSVNEIANMISKNQIHIEQRQGEVFSTLANIDKITNDVKWSPNISLKTWIQNEIR